MTHTAIQSYVLKLDFAKTYDLAMEFTGDAKQHIWICGQHKLF